MYTKYHYLNSISLEVTAIGAAPYFKAFSYIIQITQRKQQLLVHTYMVERGQTMMWDLEIITISWQSFQNWFNQVHRRSIMQM